MRAGTRKESIESRGGTARNDWFNPVDGGGLGNGSLSETKSTGPGTGGARRGGTDAFSEAEGLEPVSTVVDAMECPGGVCPVPWVTKEEPPVVQEDVVNHPSHYTDNGSIECIEAIEAQLTAEEYLGYLRGNCVKYLWRWRNKGGVVDLNKASWYLQRLIETQDQNG